VYFFPSSLFFFMDMKWIKKKVLFSLNYKILDLDNRYVCVYMLLHMNRMDCKKKRICVSCMYIYVYMDRGGLSYIAITVLGLRKDCLNWVK
jgi:hypothetical protein